MWVFAALGDFTVGPSTKSLTLIEKRESSSPVLAFLQSPPPPPPQESLNIAVRNLPNSQTSHEEP